MSAGPFRSFAHRRFAIVWAGMACSAIGTWMQIIAQSLVTLRVTHGSAFALGGVLLAQAAPFLLFALIGGGIADAVDKRTLLLVSQSSLAALAALLGALTAAGRIELWMILAIAFLSGSILSADQPARAVLLPSLVPDAERTNAIALQSTVFQGASIVGPALAGIVAARIGYSACFYFNALSYLGVLIALLAIRDGSRPTAQPRQPVARALAELFDAIRRDGVLGWALSGYALMLFATPSAALLLPVLARSVWRIPDSRLGILFACSGLGAVAGSLWIAHRGDRGSKGAVHAIGMFASAVSLAVYPNVRPPWMIASLLFSGGAGQAVTSAITSTLLQGRVPPRLRGRVMSLNTLLLMGVRPLGDFPAGMLIGLAGPQRAALLCATLVAAGAALLLPSRNPLRSA